MATELSDILSLRVALLILGAGLLYSAYIVIHRLYFHPLAKFPGPKLVAASYWPEFYWDAIRPGQYIWRVKEMHEKYGPIIRISPDQLEIFDPDYYQELYGYGSHKRDKWSETAQTLGVDLSVISTPSHELHRIRRAALNPFFSKASVRSLQPRIDGKIDIFLQRLKDFQKSGEVLTINRAFGAFTNGSPPFSDSDVLIFEKADHFIDIVMEYAFGYSKNRLLEPDFDPAFHDNMIEGMLKAPLMRFMKFIPSVLQALPLFITNKIAPAYVDFLDDLESFANEVRAAAKLPSSSESGSRTIFREVLDSKLPPEEKSVSRISQDASIVVAAGTLTTAWALAVATFNILSLPSVCQKLRDELKTVSDSANLGQLEELPYLTACIQEGLRLSYGSSNRMIRIAPDETMVYKDGKKEWYIPKNTPVSMCAVYTHQDPKIFPEPFSYRPERWIENPRLDRYLISFGKGPRQCAGINLAYAELYLLLAALFSRYGSPECKRPGDLGVLELYETDYRDVELVIDAGVPMPREGSKGVRVRVLNP